MIFQGQFRWPISAQAEMGYCKDLPAVPHSLVSHQTLHIPSGRSFAEKAFMFCICPRYFYFIASFVDSLCAVKKLVFEDVKLDEIINLIVKADSTESAFVFTSYNIHNTQL